MNDTGMNLPESRETLLLQQRQLLEGKRFAQMFPVGTEELPLPKKLERIELERGVFHFNPLRISAATILRASLTGRENTILSLGPYNKAEVLARVYNGEPLFTVVELNDGVEVKAAIGTPSTMLEQVTVFLKTCLDDSSIVIEPVSSVLLRRVGAKNGRN